MELLREIESFLEFYEIDDIKKRKSLIKKYKNIITEIGNYFDEPRMAHMLIEMDENEMSEKKWLDKIKNDQQVVLKWQPKWEGFVQSLSISFPDEIAKYFKGAKLVFGYINIAAAASKFTHYNIVLKRKNGEIIRININDAGWKQVMIIDNKHDIFSNERCFNKRFKVERDIEKQFQDTLENIGIKVFCEEMDNICDEYSRENRNIPIEEIKKRENEDEFWFIKNKKG